MISQFFYYISTKLENILAREKNIYEYFTHET